VKKIFKLTDEKKAPERIVEAIKHELRKYVKREQNKKSESETKLFWETQCRFGKSEAESNEMGFDALIKELDTVIAAGWSECFIEVVVSSKEWEPKPKSEESTEAGEVY